MTEKPETVLEKVQYTNPTNSSEIQEFYQFVADNFKSDRYKNSDL
jgi:hypothetical protein